jgi:peptidyl-prolyl cis-trans isomerase SurA
MDHSPGKITFGLMMYVKKIFTVVIALFAVYSIAQGQARKAVADKIVAIVGDRIILQSDIWNSILDAQRNGQQVPADAACNLMEQAVISKVLMLQAEKDSLPVTDEDVEAELDQKIRYYIGQVGTQEALEEMAGKTVYQIKDEGREAVREQKLSQAMQQKIVGNVKVTPTEVKAFFDRIPTDSLPFFESELEVGQIVLFPKASRDLEEYIVAELNNYKKQIEAKTTTFDKVARSISEDGTRDRGGLMEIDRNQKDIDPVFLSTSFRLKEGEISVPVKSKFGYHLIQMIKRSGDKAQVAHIIRIPPVTEDEIKPALAKLDSIRSKIIAGNLAFNEAATKYSEDPNVKFTGPFMLNRRDGSPYVYIDDLDKDAVAVISKLKVGDISAPMPFESEEKKKGVRIVYFKSRTEPHRMNLRDDYSRIAQSTLEQKKSQTLEKWIKTKLPTYYIMVDNATGNECPDIQKYASTTPKGY